MAQNFVFQTPRSAFDELFGNNNVNVTEISVLDLEPSAFNRFKPYSENKMQELAENIKVNGVIEPIIVRKKDRGYEILSGHNRVTASKIAGKEKIPAIIKEGISDSEAINIVAYSNLKRDKIYPSELAETYKLLMETNNTTSCRTLADLVGDNERKIQRYYRLNFLSADLKQMVDDGEISLIIGVSLSYLKDFEQDILYKYIKQNNIKLKEDDAYSLKRYSTEMNDSISIELLNTMFKIKSDKQCKNSYKIKIDRDIYETYFNNLSKKEFESKIKEIINFYYNNH